MAVSKLALFGMLLVLISAVAAAENNTQTDVAENTNLFLPGCNCEEHSCSCCLPKMAPIFGGNTCADLTYYPKELTAKASLIVKGEEYGSKEFGVKSLSICFPPGLPAGVCLGINQFHLEKGFIKICPKLKASLIVKDFDFYPSCVQFKDGSLSTAEPDNTSDDEE